MKICLIAAFPPSGRQLNEYSFHLASELKKIPGVELTILADELTEYYFATDSDGEPVRMDLQPELDGFHVIRCWKFGSVTAGLRILAEVRRQKPDVVWFNLVFSSFGAPENPMAAFAGLAAPALTRAAGYFTHVTLHHIAENVDFAAAGVHRQMVYHLGARTATRLLLRANSVSVLLSCYQRTLETKYGARNVLLSTHGTYTGIAAPPDFTKRGNPDQRILAIGHWGTYKRLEKLMEAFPAVLDKVPHARLIVAGSNHHTRPGYWESVRDRQPKGLPIEFRGYTPESEIPELFKTASVLVLPYDSTTGPSGPAHQACAYGLPIVCADIPDFRTMAEDENMAIRFYRKGDAGALAGELVTVLKSPALQSLMGLANYAAGLEMSIASVAQNYIRWFQLEKCKSDLERRTWHAPWSTVPTGPIESPHPALGDSIRTSGAAPEEDLAAFAMADSDRKRRTA